MTNSNHRRLTSRLERPPPHLELAHLPTPTERLGRVGASASEVELWVKRDDLSHPVYGGGKPRKLEWILGAEPASPHLISSVGATGSHHLLALAIHLRPLTLPLHAFVFEQSVTPHVRRNFAALVSCGVRIERIAGRIGLPWAWVARRTWRRPELPERWVAAGGSDGLGALGFVEAGLELAAQIEAGELPVPDHIYITAGTAGSSAGLLVGLALAGRGCHLHLVSAVEAIGFNRWMLAWKLRQTWRSLRHFGLRLPEGSGRLAPEIERCALSWSLDHSQVGRGYGHPTAAGEQAIACAQQEFGLALEPTYTGKCMAALLADQKSGRVKPGQKILFWNTHAGPVPDELIDPGWRSRVPAGLFSNALLES